MKTITELVKDGKTLISDGAWGTFLQKRGLKVGDCPELWCIEHRDVVLEIAQSYVDAGSDMIETNSFGGSSIKLDHFGLASRDRELNEAAAAISREAAGNDRHVIASVGPTGKILMMGDVTEDQVYDAFSRQLTALEKGGASACCIESFSALDEASLAVRAAKQDTALEIICTFTFDRTQQGEYRTMMGVSPAEMASAMIEAGADIIGANCSQGMELMAGLVREFRQNIPELPILIHANAGMPIMVDGKDTFPETPGMMSESTIKVVRAGANIVGGCCGTTPEHITAIAKAVREI